MQSRKSPHLMIMLIMMISLPVFPGCGTSKPEVIYAGTVRSSEETIGRLRLAQPEVDVVADGDERVSKLSNTGNYFVVWVEDLTAAVQAVVENKKLKSEIRELKAKIAQLENQ